MRKKKGGGEGGGREEVERGREVKKEGGKKEGVNKKSASFNTRCMPTMHSRWLSDLN